MKILVLCYEYPPIGGGGGRAAKDVATELARRGHEVRVQTAGMRHLAEREEHDGVDVFRTQSYRRHEDRCSVPEMALFLFTSFVPTLRHIRRWRPDVIHAHFAVPTGALAWAAHLLTRTPYVLTVQLGDVPGGVPEQTQRLFRILKPLTVPIWKRAAAITVVSEFVKELAIRGYDLPVVKIPNGISLDDRPTEPSAVGEPPHLVAIGRLNPQKNFPFLIKALGHLRDVPWKLTLIGDGTLMPEVRQEIAIQQIDERVTLPGWLEARDVQRVLATGDIFLMPSLSEGLPLAALEALKHGLAIVGSDIGGLEDVIDEAQNGYRFPVNDLQSFIAKLRSLLVEPDQLLEMKRASHRKTHEFDITTIATAYEEVLLRAASRSSRDSFSRTGSDLRV